MEPQPHDVLFHWVVAHPEEARALLEGVLPPAIVALVDWSALEVDVGRIDAPELVTRVPDAICRAPLRGGGTLEVAIILEHQSRPDRDMPLRMFLSQALVWSEDARHERPMSVCLGLVIHHGSRRWNAPRSVREHFAPSPDLDAILGPYLPSHPYLVVDLAGLDPNAIASAPVRSPLVRAMLFALQRAREAAAIDEELALIEGDLRAMAERADAEQALTAFFRYLLSVVPERAGPIRSRLHRTVTNDLEARIMGTIFDEHVERGIAIGEARGEARGELVTRREILLEVLEARFGALPRPIVERIDAATRDELRTWHRRSILVASLDEVFVERS